MMLPSSTATVQTRPGETKLKAPPLAPSWRPQLRSCPAKLILVEPGHIISDVDCPTDVTKLPIAVIQKT